ncbi:hypothetical protein HPP92_019369 [Vanilla planifolia]|uniref:Stigma-specific STIG1-like protein 1 n=1 Tax=Vanilla planifolia TaxID=51239 RepID=A0A835UJS2_VANPL|nr:hypothetical protein HPP92_019369 [Vanilla planifolia]
MHRVQPPQKKRLVVLFYNLHATNPIPQPANTSPFPWISYKSSLSRIPPASFSSKRASMALSPKTILLLAISAAILLACFDRTDAGASRFLAQLEAKNKKCRADPTVCRMPGSGGPTCCANRCVDTSTDRLHCGRCGKICKFTDSCCGGKCVDIISDKRNCGSCGQHCPQGVKCLFGMCQYA